MYFEAHTPLHSIVWIPDRLTQHKENRTRDSGLGHWTVMDKLLFIPARVMCTF